MTYFNQYLIYLHQSFLMLIHVLSRDHSSLVSFRNLESIINETSDRNEIILI